MQRITRDSAIDREALDNLESQVELFQKYFPPSIAHFFAKPRVGADGMLEWWSELMGQPVLFHDLNKDQQRQLLEKYQQRQEGVRHLAKELSQRGQVPVSAGLSNLIGSPDLDNLYSINGEPLVIRWHLRPPELPPLELPKKKPFWLLLFLIPLLLGFAWWFWYRNQTVPTVENSLPPLAKLQLPKESEKLSLESEKLSLESEKLSLESEKLSLESEKLSLESEKLSLESEEPPPRIEPSPPPIEPPPPPIEPPPPPIEPPPPPIEPPPPPIERPPLPLYPLGKKPMTPPPLELSKQKSPLKTELPTKTELLAKPKLLPKTELQAKSVSSQLSEEATKKACQRKPGELPPQFVVALDTSGSMDFNITTSYADEEWYYGKIHNRSQLTQEEKDRKFKLRSSPTRLSVAKRSLMAMTGNLQRDIDMRLITFGGECHIATDHGTIEYAQRPNFLGGLTNLEAQGSTPLTLGLTKAASTVDGRQRDAIILMFIDGDESCNGDVCAVAARLAQEKPRLKVHVVDIAGGANIRNTRCITGSTGGRIYSADNVTQATAVLKDATKEISKDNGCD